MVQTIPELIASQACFTIFDIFLTDRQTKEGEIEALRSELKNKFVLNDFNGF